MGRACSTLEGIINVHTILVVEPAGKRSLGKPWNSGRIILKCVFGK
jgi:hypothetical protein